MASNSSITVGVASATNNGSIYSTSLQSNKHNLIADEPPSMGGNNEGPSPGDYLCMALASCKAITLRMYIQRKNWPVEEVTVNVELQKDDLSGQSPNRFNCEVMVTGNVTNEQKERLLQIAKACPISRLLTKTNEVNTTVK